MSKKAAPDLETELEPLFRVPLSEFIAERNALATRLKKGGRTMEAERVKAIAKPSPAAWAVNQLYWQDPKAIDALLDVAERARKVQTGHAKSGNLRELLDDKKRRVAELVREASAILNASGRAPSADVVRRVSTTLEALAVWGKAEGAPKAGQLTAELDPPGFDALAALMGGAKNETAKVLLFPKPKPRPDLTAAREAVKAAERTLQEARREAERAQAVLTKANARTESLEKERQEIERRYAEALEEAEAASVEAERKGKVVAEAERALTKAQDALK